MTARGKPVQISSPKHVDENQPQMIKEWEDRAQRRDCRKTCRPEEPHLQWTHSSGMTHSELGTQWKKIL